MTGHDDKRQNVRKCRGAWDKLVAALFSVGLSVALLAGATFAWYTASVTTPAQVIQTGNIDAQLKYASLSGDGIVWLNAADSGAVLFGDCELDPGKLLSVALMAGNNGSIDFSYDLSPIWLGKNIGYDLQGNPIDLSKLVRVAILDLGTDLRWQNDPAGVNARLLAKLTTDGYKLLECYSNQAFTGDTETGTLAYGEAHYYAVGLYVPENVNLAYGGAVIVRPDVTLRLQLRASQIVDRFTQKKAPLPWNGTTVKVVEPTTAAENIVFNVSTAEELVYVLNEITMPANGTYPGNVAININSDIEFNGCPLGLGVIPYGTHVTVNGGGHTIYNLCMLTGNQDITEQTPKLFNSNEYSVTYNNVNYLGVEVMRYQGQ